MMLPHDFEPMT